MHGNMRESRESGNGGVRGTREGIESLKLKPSVFRVESKSFFIEIDKKSQGETVIITERSRSRCFQIGIGLGCAAWLIDQLRKASLVGEHNFCKVFRGNNYTFWVEIYRNKNGPFMKLSRCGRYEAVHSVILPKGEGNEGWQRMEENLNTFLFGKSKEEVKQVLEKTTMQNQRERLPEDQLESNYSFTTQGGTKTQKLPVNKKSWDCTVICERQAVFQSWKNIERGLSKWLGKQVQIYPYQNNRAFFVCENSEEAEQIASHGKLALLGQPEVLLFEWAQGLTNNLKKVVSYGGWIAVKGLPLHCWSQKYFKQVGDTCGGLLEVDNRTEGFKHLYEARIRVKQNETGFLPELMKLTEGNQTHIVRIQSTSSAKQPPKARRKELQFHFLCKKKLTEAAGDSIFEDGDNRNTAGHVFVGKFPERSRSPEDVSSKVEVTRGSPQNVERQYAPAGLIENIWEAANIPWEKKKLSVEVERADTENFSQVSMPSALLAGGAQLLKKSMPGAFSAGGAQLLKKSIKGVLIRKEQVGQTSSFNRAPLESGGFEVQGKSNAMTCKHGILSGKKGARKSHSEDRGKQGKPGDFKPSSATSSLGLKTSSKPPQKRFFRRYSEGDFRKYNWAPGLDRPPRLETNLPSISGNVSSNLFRVLKPEDFGGRRYVQTEQSSGDKRESCNSVLRGEDEDEEEDEDDDEGDDADKNEQEDEQEMFGKEQGNEGSLEELEKDECNWRSNQVELEDIIGRDGEENLYADIALDDLLSSNSSHGECSDADFSSVEGTQHRDPLEDEEFSLEGFMEGQTINNTLAAIQEDEGKVENGNNYFLIKESKKDGAAAAGKNGDVNRVRKQVQSSNKQPKRKEGTNSTNESSLQTQKKVTGLQKMGKIGKFLVPMKLKVYARKKQKSKNSLDKKANKDWTNMQLNVIAEMGESKKFK